MAWPKGKPRRPAPALEDGAVPAESGSPGQASLSAASEPEGDASSNPSGSPNVLMRLPDGRVTEVHRDSVATVEDWGWVKHGADG